MTNSEAELIVSIVRNKGECYQVGAAYCKQCPFSTQYCAKAEVYVKAQEYILEHPELFMEALL